MLTEDAAKPDQDVDIARTMIAVDRFAATLTNVAAGIVAGFDQFFTVLGTAVMPIATRVYNAVMEIDRREGAPYGDSHEGMMRWLDDKVAEQRERNRHW